MKASLCVYAVASSGASHWEESSSEEVAPKSGDAARVALVATRHRSNAQQQADWPWLMELKNAMAPPYPKTRQSTPPCPSRSRGICSLGYAHSHHRRGDGANVALAHIQRSLHSKVQRLNAAETTLRRWGYVAS